MDHARVVGIMRKADQLPLVKDYLLAVQKTNLAAVNEAVNQLLIEEEDYGALRDSITTYDNYDQIGLATALEKHELTEFRRIAAQIYKANLRWRKAVTLAQQDHLYKVWPRAKVPSSLSVYSCTPEQHLIARLRDPLRH